MRKSLIIIACIALTILLIAGAKLSTIPDPRNRLYAGDRFTGSFSMTVEGIPYVPEGPTLRREGMSGSQRLNSDGMGTFSIKGGDKALYEIVFIIENDKLFELTQDSTFNSYGSDPTLTFAYFNYNWWLTTEMILTADMYLSDGQWVVDCKVLFRVSTEAGGFREETIEKRFVYSELVSGGGTVMFGL